MFEIRSISDALESPGVKLILTGRDVMHLKPLATSYRPDNADGSPFVSRDIPILCLDQTQYSGDAIAFIVAETLEQAEVLRKMNCPIAQGFYFSRPLGVTACTAFLRAAGEPMAATA